MVVRQSDAVVYIAKVRILEQITTARLNRQSISRCCLYSKGKNFRANHNENKYILVGNFAVVYIAKVRILEQITTICFNALDVVMLLFI